MPSLLTRMSCLLKRRRLTTLHAPFLTVLAASALCGIAHADYIVTISQVGSNVVATGAGTVDLTGLSFITTGSGCTLYVDAQYADLATGQTNSNCALYSGGSFVSSFGAASTRGGAASSSPRPAHFHPSGESSP